MTTTVHARSPEATRRLARVAGAVYVALGVAAAAGFFHAPVVQTDVHVIARLLMTSDARFNLGVTSDVLATVLAVPLAVLLYQLFKPVDETNSRLMAALLIVAMPISFVVALDYVAARFLLVGAPFLQTIPGAEREALATLFLRLHVHGVLAVEILWGLWLLPFGLLVMRSRFLPRALGGLLIIGGVAYVAHSLTSLLLGGQRFALLEAVAMLARAAAEFPVMLWLVVKGASVAGSSPEAA